MPRDSIVIIGAGIIGLDVALELCQRGYGSQVTIVASHLPGDQSIDYTSPCDANAIKWDRAGYISMWKLIEEESPEARFLAKTKSTEYFDLQPDIEKIESMKGYLEDLEILSPDKLPSGVAYGITFTTITINAPAHIAHTANLLQSPPYGSIPIIQRRLSSLHSAFLSENTKIVFNCIGNAARTLPGVMDVASYPTRGQVVLVRAPRVRENVMRHGDGYETYVITRPNSNGAVILGGYMQKGNSSGEVVDAETNSILKRTSQLVPELQAGCLEVLAVAVGLRPSRVGGARVEPESAGEERLVVHNCGAGGTGFQAGMGMAVDAVDLAKGNLDTLRERSLL